MRWRAAWVLSGRDKAAVPEVGGTGKTSALLAGASHVSGCTSRRALHHDAGYRGIRFVASPLHQRNGTCSFASWLPLCTSGTVLLSKFASWRLPFCSSTSYATVSMTSLLNNLSKKYPRKMLYNTIVDNYEDVNVSPPSLTKIIISVQDWYWWTVTHPLSMKF